MKLPRSFFNFKPFCCTFFPIWKYKTASFCQFHRSKIPWDQECAYPSTKTDLKTHNFNELCDPSVTVMAVSGSLTQTARAQELSKKVNRLISIHTFIVQNKVQNLYWTTSPRIRFFHRNPSWSHFICKISLQKKHKKKLSWNRHLYQKIKNKVEIQNEANFLFVIIILRDSYYFLLRFGIS